MGYKIGLWLVMMACVWGWGPGAAAQNPPTAQEPAAAATPSAAAEGESATNDPGADEGGQQQRRRRMVTTTTAQLKIGDKSIGMTAGILKSDGPDYESIAKLGEGDVLLLTRSQTIKLKTDLPLTFGDVTLKTENVAKGYAGVYGIWLRKTADGWHFVFNEKADLWGTMHDPAADVAEIPVTYTKLTEPVEAMKFDIPQDGQGGTIKISWGEHEWSAPFTFAN